jgi:transposase-like protein
VQGEKDSLVNNVNKHMAPAPAPAPTRRPTPIPEVVAQAKRRRFTAEYKQRILADADRVKGSGGVGALLRRESLYSSLLTTWRRERDAVVLQALARPKNADPSPSAIPSPKKTTSCAGRLCN